MSGLSIRHHYPLTENPASFYGSSFSPCPVTWSVETTVVFYRSSRSVLFVCTSLVSLEIYSASVFCRSWWRSLLQYFYFSLWCCLYVSASRLLHSTRALSTYYMARSDFIFPSCSRSITSRDGSNVRRYHQASHGSLSYIYTPVLSIACYSSTTLTTCFAFRLHP